MTERFHFHFSLSCIGEGNGNPLQYSCLENPRDGGAWWAFVYGVAQSWSQLKQLSSSSSKLIHSLPSQNAHIHVCAQQLQSCPTLCDPMDCSPPGSSAHGILQARILEWVAMPTSRESSRPRDGTGISCVSFIAGRFFTTELPGKSHRMHTLVELMNKYTN